MLRRLRQIGVSLGAVFIALIVFLQVPLSGQSAQIQAALRAFLTQSNFWTGTQTFTDISVTGTCSGCTGSGAPDNATYVTQTPNVTLTNEQALSALASGIMRVANSTGVVTSLTTSAGIAANISDETGTGVLVFSTSPTLVTPILGTPTSGTLTNTTGFPVANLAGAGTGVLTALGVNIGSAGAPVLFNGAGGTPSSMTATNLTGTAAGLTAGAASAVAVGGITGLGTGVATWLATPSSANLASAVTGETGSGALVFGTSPTLAAPALTGDATSTGTLHFASTTVGDHNAVLSIEFQTPDVMDGFARGISIAGTTVATNDGMSQRGIINEQSFTITSGHTAPALGGYTAFVYTYGPGTITDYMYMFGGDLYGNYDASGTGTINKLAGLWLNDGVTDGHIVNMSGTWIEPMTKAMGATIDFFVGHWVGAQGGLATNTYSFWSDEQGVYRIRSDNTFNSVYQAIPALYNPQFTKYTPGAMNFERIIEQWESNVGVLGIEAGGTGTLRSLKLRGGGLILDSAMVTPAMSGTRYLCIGTTGIVTSSATACSGT